MTSTNDPPHNQEFQLTVPFKCCKSEGGTYDDASFVAGFNFGMLWHDLQKQAKTITLISKEELALQLDLAAMYFGYTINQINLGMGWVKYEFTKQ